MTERLQDHRARARAIDPHRSVIIQAPAGSGKTELLVQRLLALLAAVDNPRRVLAITFTRKATQQMANRVRGMLLLAAAGQVPEPAYQRTAYDLAVRVLERDRALGWNLLEDPAQLQIHTIDGLCTRLAALGGGDGLALAASSVVEHPERLYAEATRRAIEHAASLATGRPERQALEALLLRQRGNLRYLAGMLQAQLGRRDQWLAGLQAHGNPDSAVLHWRRAVEMDALAAALGPDRLEAALAALEQLAGSAREAVAAAPLLGALRRVRDRGSHPASRVEDMHAALSALAIATGEPMAGRTVNSRLFPGDHPGRGAWIETLADACEAWRTDPAAAAMFQRFVKAPPFDAQPDDQRLVASMRPLLMLACAELQVLFAERGECDFQHVAERALAALGGDLAPGHALLVEDGRLQHILVDEFQDTSITQYQLLERLTAGWEAGDGRSLFLVGDPMQSIYRFRKADVSLYRQVHASGRLGDVLLEPLRLLCNFRSAGEIVAFVNHWLPAVFGPVNPAACGAVAYVPVIAQQGPGGRVAWHPAHNDEQAGEAARVARLVAELVDAHPGASIGILARKRAQLTELAPALTAAGVSFEAVDIEPLQQRQVIQDLLALLRALLHPADRVAWLATLHAPWCGLEPAELHQLAGESFEDDVLARAGDESLLGRLDAGTAGRVRHWRGVMSASLDAAGRAVLSRRLEAAWIRLGGPCIVATAGDLDDAQAFFDLLASVEARSPADLWGELLQALEHLFAGASPALVQLMTIHKAKGLEFDHVVLPGLDQRVGGPRHELFRQQEFHTDDGASGVLAAPVDTAGSQGPSLFRYLRRLDEEAEACEAQRVLYVALTRARHGLHLFGHWAMKGSGKKRAPGAPAGSFLDLLWAPFEQELSRRGWPEPTVTGPAAGEPVPLPLLRLEGAPECAIPAAPPPAGEQPFRLELPDRAATSLGEAFHRWMELMHDHPEAGWSEDALGQRRDALAASLRIAGAGEAELPSLTEQLQALLQFALANPRVKRWLAGRDAGSHSEFVICHVRDGRLKTSVIDLLVPEAGGSWTIVDWKTSAGESFPAWREQLAAYAQACEQAGLGPVRSLQVCRVLANGTVAVHDLQSGD